MSPLRDHQAITLENIALHFLRHSHMPIRVATVDVCASYHLDILSLDLRAVDPSAFCGDLMPLLRVCMKWEAARQRVRLTIPQPMKLVISALAGARTPDGSVLTEEEWAQVLQSPDARIRAAAMVQMGGAQATSSSLVTVYRLEHATTGLGPYVFADAHPDSAVAQALNPEADAARPLAANDPALDRGINRIARELTPAELLDGMRFACASLDDLQRWFNLPALRDACAADGFVIAAVRIPRSGPQVAFGRTQVCYATRTGEVVARHAFETLQELRAHAPAPRGMPRRFRA